MIMRNKFYNCCSSLWLRPSQSLLRIHTKSLSPASTSAIEPNFSDASGSLCEIASRIRALCEKSVPQVEDAFILFDRAIDSHGPPSGSTCRFLFTTLSKLDKYNLAIQVYSKVSGIHKFHSYSSLHSLIHCFLHLSEPDFAIGVLAVMIKLGFEVNTLSVNAILLQLCRNGDVSQAVKLFHEWCSDETDTLRINHDIVSYNVLINGLGKEGRMEEAMDLLEDMKQKGLNANVVTYGTLIKGFCDAGNFDRAKQLSNIMLEKGIEPNKFIYASLLHFLSKTRRWEEASDLLKVMLDRGIEPNVVMYNQMIDGLCKDGRPLEAKRLLNLMAEKGEEPNTTTYNSLINGFCKAGLFAEAFKVFENMKPNMVSFNTLASRLSENGKVYESLELLKNVTEPDCCTLTALVNGLCKIGRVRKAEKIHRKMVTKVKPKILPFTLMIKAYMKEGYVEKVMQLWRNSVEMGLVPDSYTYLVMIQGFWNIKMTNIAKGLFLHMGARGISPTNSHINLILGSLCKDCCLEEAKGFFYSIPHPDVISFSTLIHGVLKAGDLQSGKELFDKMILKGIAPNLVTFSILVNGFIKFGWLEEAKYVFEKMLACGYEPNVALYDSLLKGFCRMGEKEEFIGLLTQMAAKGVRLDDDLTRTILNSLCVFPDLHNIQEILPNFQRETGSKVSNIPCDEFLSKVRKKVGKEVRKSYSEL